MEYQTHTVWRKTAMYLSRWARRLCVLGFFGGVVFHTAWAGTVQGMAAYRERIALPGDAVFEAELQDVSLADAPAKVLGRIKQEPAGQPPFRFKIAYDDAAIRAGHRYAVRATVRRQGRLLFTTDTVYPVLDGHSAPLQMLLVAVRSEPFVDLRVDDQIGALPASFSGEFPGAGGGILWQLNLFPQGRYQLRTTYVNEPKPTYFDEIGRWAQDEEGRLVLRNGREEPVFLMPETGGVALRKLDFSGKPIQASYNDRLVRQAKLQGIEPRLLLNGMFIPAANTGRITLCADGQSLPVAMAGDYKALQAAYRQAKLQPRQPLLVNFEGQIMQRPVKKNRRVPQTILVIKKFITTRPGETCSDTGR